MSADGPVRPEKPRQRIDKGFYDRVRAAAPSFELMERFVIPPFSGLGFKVDSGQSFRIIQEAGPQVAIVAFWNAHDPKETYGPIRNRTWEGVFVTTYTRMWSEPPWLRPMLTCIEDTVTSPRQESDFHHHRFWTHCSAETMEMASGIKGLHNCHDNLTKAIEPFSLKPKNIHENVNLFQKVRLDATDGKFYGAPGDSEKGDYVEFYAEMDLLVAVSVCPMGDNTRDWSTPEDNTVSPLGVAIYDTGFKPQQFPVWTDWRPNWTGKWIPPH